MTTSKWAFVQFDSTMILQRIKEFVAFVQCDSTFIFSCASAKADRSLSSLSCVCVYVHQNKGTPPPEMAYPLGIP